MIVYLQRFFYEALNVAYLKEQLVVVLPLTILYSYRLLTSFMPKELVMNMQMIIKILEGTPSWVFGILAYLLWIGYLATKTRKVYIPRLLILPALLLSLRLRRLFIAGASATWFFLLIFLLVGILAGWCTAYRQKCVIDKEKMAVTIPGSWTTMFFILTIFVVRYYCGYNMAVYPEFAQYYATIDISVAAAISGVSLGRVLFFFNAYRLK